MNLKPHAEFNFIDCFICFCLFNLTENLCLTMPHLHGKPFENLFHILNITPQFPQLDKVDINNIFYVN